MLCILGLFLGFLITHSESGLLCNSALWSTIKGDWTISGDSSSLICSAQNIDSSAGNVIWIGSSDGLKPNSSFDFTAFKLEVKLSLSSQDTNESDFQDAGILFRAMNVSTVNNGGQQYYYGISAHQNLIQLGKMDGEWSKNYKNEYYTIDYGITYKLTIISLGIENKYEFYIEDQLIFANVTLNDYIHGSIGLRTHYQPCSYSRVSLTHESSS